MDPIKHFPGKILLFGEYTVLSGGTALTIPFLEKTGFLDFSSLEQTEHIISQNKIVKFCNYLLNHGIQNLELSQFNEDIKRGLFFNSNIPENYGVGSSGALVAAVYDRYSKNKETDLLQLKKELSQMEAFFHGSSSGIDPLSCFIKKPLLFKDQVIEIIESLPNSLQMFLVDTGISRQTGNFVKKFISKSSKTFFTKVIENELIPSVEKAIAAFLSSDKSTLLGEFQKISIIQFDHFKEMIPQNIIGLWKKGIETTDYFLKLCGAGGGGYVLGITGNGKITHFNFPVIPLK